MNNLKEEDEKKLWDKARVKEAEFFKGLLNFSIFDANQDFIQHVGLWVSGKTLFFGLGNNCFSWEISELKEKEVK